MNELVTQEATVNIFIRNGAQWVIVAGELFGPYPDYHAATSALPGIFRDLE